MAKIVCSACCDYVDAKKIRVCGDCDTVVCTRCAQHNQNLCGECYGDMNYVN